MAKREKKVIVTGVTRERAEGSFADYASADAKQQRITAGIDVQVTKIREKYQDELAELQRIKDDAFDIMETFAKEKKDELFLKKKSMEFAHGILGFRMGTPKLKLRKGFTWAGVLELLKVHGSEYVRKTEEPAKDKLLADRDVPESQEVYAKVGVFVDQDETFFVEPKKEEVAA
jgi:phage host-nuclease inhibitor protein Gam